MSNLTRNIRYSNAVCSQILNNYKVKGANWDYYQGEKNSYEACSRQRRSFWDNLFGKPKCETLMDSTDIMLYQTIRGKEKPLIMRNSSKRIEQIRLLANLTLTYKAANCGEFALTAFYLLYVNKILPVEWVSLKGNDHSFVIIDRSSGDINDYSSWGGNAVICDPWARGLNNGLEKIGTYEGKFFAKNMRTLVGSFTGVNIIHKEN